MKRLTLLAFATLAGISAVSGQTSSQCSAATTTISAASDGFSLAAGCPTFTGDVAIATSASDSIELDGLEEIRGDFILDNVTDLVSISSDSLHTVSGTLRLNDVIILSTFDFGNLTTVDTLELTSLPNQQSLSFFTTVQNCNNITIQNTGISELRGFDLESVTTVRIENNVYLESLNLQFGSVNGSIYIGANGRALDVSFPNLESVRNMTMRNATDINTPSLRRVDGSIVFEYNRIEEYDSPVLGSISNSLALIGNQELVNLTLTSLESIGGALIMQNNTNLTVIDRLEGLATVGGAVDLAGPLEELTLPSLNEVQGSFLLNSSEAVNCSRYARLNNQGDIGGNFRCFTENQLYIPTEADNATTTSDSDGSASTSGGSGSDSSQPLDDSEDAANASEGSGDGSDSGLSTGAQAGIGVGVAAACIAAASILFFFFWRKRRAARTANFRSQSDVAAEKDGHEIDGPAMLGTGSDKHELEQPVPEMPLGQEAQELPAKHGVAEVGRSLSTKAPEGIEQRHEMDAGDVPEGYTRR